MQFLSLLFGIVGLGMVFIALIPLLGWLNWFIIPFTVAGLVIGVVGLTNAKGGKGVGTAGVILCVSAIVIGVVRLMLGGGII